MKTIKDLPVNSRAVITGYKPRTESYRSRLFSMGLTRGAQFTVKRIAPLGDPVEVEIRGCMTTLRKQEADMIIIEEITDEI